MAAQVAIYPTFDHPGAGLLLTYSAYLVLIISGFAAEIMDNLEGSYSLHFMVGQ